jgi:hypothetical protein
VAEADEKTITISDADFDEVERTLPTAADRTYVRNRLKQIKQSEITLAKTLPEQLAAQWEIIARRCEELRGSLDTELAELPEPEPREQRVAFLQELKRRGDAAEKQIALYRQISKARRPAFRRHCTLLWLWEAIGGDLGISNPPRKLRDEATWPLPTGPVIAYFQAAAKAVFGETPGAWQIRDIVRDFQRLHLAARLSTEGNLSVDDSKIFILHDGKHIDKDGNVVET